MTDPAHPVTRLLWMSCDRFVELLGPLPEVVRQNAIAKALSEAPGLTDLSRQQKQVVSGRFMPLAFPSGTKIYEQGAPEDKLYVLLKGKVTLTVSDCLTSQLLLDTAGHALRTARPSSDAAAVQVALTPRADGLVSLRLVAEPRRHHPTGKHDVGGEQMVAGSGQTFGGALNAGAEQRAYADSAIAITHVELLAISCSELAGLLAKMPPSAAVLAQQERQRRCREHRRFQALTLHRSDLEATAILSSSPTAKVRLVRRRGRDNVYTLKSISKLSVIESKAVTRVLAEKRILDTLDHPFCIHLFQVFSDTDPHGSVHLLLDAYMGGTLQGLMRDVGCLDLRSSRFYSACVTSALGHLHQQSIVYRSLHPSTIGIDVSGYAKLIDFGYARILRNGAKTFTLCGTPEYLAPELVTSAGHCMPVDMWAFGILTFEMLHGSTPFDDHTSMEIYRKIIAGKVTYPPGELPMVKDLLRRLLEAEPRKRPTHRNVRRTLFFQAVDFARLEKMDSSGPPWKPSLRSASDPRYCLPTQPISSTDTDHVPERKDLTGLQKDICRLEAEFVQL